MTYTAFSHYGRGKVRRTRTTTATRQVFTTRTGGMNYDIRGRNIVVTGESIAIAGRGAVETRWRVYPDDCDRHGKVMAIDIVTMGFNDAAPRSTERGTPRATSQPRSCEAGSCTRRSDPPPPRQACGTTEGRCRPVRGTPVQVEWEIALFSPDLRLTPHHISGTESSFP